MRATHKKHIANAIAKKHSLMMTYHKKGTGRVVRRKIDPYEVRGNLLYAYDHKRKALRSFDTERIKHMEKSAFWEGFEKRAGAASELAGLGMLAAPSIQYLRGKPMKEDTAHKVELAGLGTLAAPYLYNVGKKLVTRGKA